MRTSATVEAPKSLPVLHGFNDLYGAEPYVGALLLAGAAIALLGKWAKGLIAHFRVKEDTQVDIHFIEMRNDHHMLRARVDRLEEKLDEQEDRIADIITTLKTDINAQFANITNLIQSLIAKK